jgi:hypothetical protein
MKASGNRGFFQNNIAMKNTVSIILLVVLFGCNSSKIDKKKIKNYESYSLDAQHRNEEVRIQKQEVIIIKSDSLK